MRRAIAILGFAGFLWAGAWSVDAQTLRTPTADAEKPPAPINGVERIEIRLLPYVAFGERPLFQAVGKEGAAIERDRLLKC